MSSKTVVHRVAGLPAGSSPASAKAILEEIFESAIEVTVRSMGVHPQAASAVVATVIFSPVPSQLRNRKHKIAEVVNFGGQPIQISLEIDTEFIGFTPLNTVDDSRQDQIDCILVSGLGSHAFGSWKERGGQYMWPIDGDDARPANVRVLLWGYDSSLSNAESFQDIEDIGQSLATALNGIHPPFAQDKDGGNQTSFHARPVVFIAHSLGGLIVKEAICHIAKDNPAYVRCVYGLVFFGVPHHGLLVEPWLRIIGTQANAALVRSLDPNSRKLQSLDRAFRKLFHHSGSQVVSIYETVKSSTTTQDSSGALSRSGESRILVNRISACGTWSDSIIQKELAVNRTHEDLPKFHGRFDDYFLILRPMLADIWATAFGVVQSRFSTNQRGLLMGKAEVAGSFETQVAHGLFQVWPIPGLEGTEQPGTDVDLIAIHGLGGHPSETWTSGQKNWLRDFLPFDVSALRVLTFGYNSIMAFNGFRPGSSTTEVAQILVDAITRLRKSHKEPKSRKIIFVCHSLGGLILKQAVLLSGGVGSKSTFTDSIMGVIFLSTPNRSNQVGYWRNFVNNIIHIEGVVDVESTFAENMESISTELGGICSRFCEQEGSGLHMFSLFEQRETLDIESLVVDQSSALLRLPTETLLPLDTDHRDMARFLTSSSTAYRTILKCINEILELRTSSSVPVLHGLSAFRLSGLLDRLGIVDVDVNPDAIQPAMRRSTDWLISHPNFMSWVQGNKSHRILWVHGPPGAGKTVIMKAVMAHMSERSANSLGTESKLIYKPIHFFFNSVDSSKNSSMAFIKSALYQIMSDKTTRFVLRYLDMEAFNESGRQSESEDELWNYLSIILKLSRGVVLQITIDALDEVLRAPSLGSVSIIDRLRTLLAVDLHGRVRLLVTHREKQVPDIAIEDDISRINVTNELTRSRVQAFIKSTVRSNLDKLSCPEHVKVTIEEKLIELSQGNYLHATLAWQRFAQGVQHWTHREISLGLRRLDDPSVSLISSYCRLLNGIDPEYRATARTAFAILQVCKEKFQPRELAFLATFYEEQERQRPVSFALETVSSLESRCLRFESFLLESCAYIVKTTEDGTIDYVHTSVKDLFTKAHINLSLEDAATLSLYTTSFQDAHRLMTHLCTSILQLEIRWQSNWVKFMEEAYRRMEFKDSETEVLAITEHTTDGRRGEDPFAEDMCLEMGRQTRERVQKSESKRKKGRGDWKDLRKTSVLDMILAEAQSPPHDFLPIRKTWITRASTTPCFVYSILHWLSHYQGADPGNRTSDHSQKYVTMLISQVGHVSHMLWVFLTRDGVPHYDWSLAASLRSYRETALLRLIARGDHPSLLRTLIDQGADPNHVTNLRLQAQDVQGEEHGISPLSWAIVCQREETFQLLLRNDRVQVNRGAMHSPKPVHFAICVAEAHYLEKLIQHPDCNVNVRDHKGTPLHLALNRQNHAAVAVILDQEYVDIWAIDFRGQSAYSRAFMHGIWGSIFERMFQVSKKNALATVSEKVEGETQLSLAVTHGWTNVEEVILREDLAQLFLVDPTTGMSPLIRTAYFGRKEKVLWMLDRVPPTGVPIRRETDRFDLLHLCADQDWEDVVRMLQRKYGLASLSSDHKGRTLLHWAMEYGWDMDKFDMLEQRHLIDCADRDGRTAMHLAVIARNMDAVKALTHTGAACFLRDKYGLTPAHLAAELGFREALIFFIAMPQREFGRTRGGTSLLHLLAMWFDGAMVHEFVSSKRALVNVVDEERCTPLHYAAMANNLSSIDALVGLGCSVNARNTSRRSPIQEAIRGGSVGAVLLLLKLGADYTVVDSFGQNCLLMSYRYNQDVMVSRFLELGCDIHTRDVFGMNPLHRACANGNVPLILHLLRSGADWKRKNKAHRKPLELAVEKRATSAVEAMVAWLWDHHNRSSSRKRLFNQALTLAICERCGTPIESILRSYRAEFDREFLTEARQIYRAGSTPEPGVLPLVVFDDEVRQAELRRMRRRRREAYMNPDEAVRLYD